VQDFRHFEGQLWDPYHRYDSRGIAGNLLKSPFLICAVIMVPDALHEKWRDEEQGLSFARDCAWAGFS